MKIIFRQTSQGNRYKHNKEVLKKLRSGEPLSSFSNQSSWFPPRPLFKAKDSSANFIKSKKVVLSFNKK